MAKCLNWEELKPVVLMVLVQTVYSLVNICYKLAANDGMNLSVLVAYRFLFGAAFILPLAFFLERKKRPKLTRRVVLYGFFCGLFGGSLGQNLYVKGLVLTSATFASAMTNLNPAITFIVAMTLRLERLEWRSAAGKAKVLGTIAGIGGAMILTFYKGLELDLWNTNINLLETTTSHRHQPALMKPQSEQKYVLGSFLSLASCVCYSLWLIIQAKAAEVYPCPYSITAMSAVASSAQGVVFALCVETDWSQWNMGLDIRLFTVAFSGIFGSGLMFSLVALCVRTKGPLFVSVFQPLMLVMVALAGSLFLEEKLHIGMVIGAILIVAGLYIVLWGKRNEIRSNSENEEQPNVVPPPQNGSRHSSRAEEVETPEEGAYIDIRPIPPPPQNDGSRHRRGRTVDKEGAETRINVPSHTHTKSSSSRGGRKGTSESDEDYSNHYLYGTRDNWEKSEINEEDEEEDEDYSNHYLYDNSKDQKKDKKKYEEEDEEECSNHYLYR